MRGDILVLDAQDALITSRAVRDLDADQLDDVATVDLDRAARLMHAAAYSATTAARRLDRAVKNRSAS